MEFTDYFHLLDKSRDDSNGTAAIKISDPALIEEGLRVSAKRIQYYNSRKEQHIRTLLERFVYSDIDRCSPKATELALGTIKVFSRQTQQGDELSTEKALNSLLQLAYDTAQNYIPEEWNSDLMRCIENSITDSLACVANTMLQLPECKSIFSKCNGAQITTDILDKTFRSQKCSFLSGRCLFLGIHTPESAVACVKELKSQDTLSESLEYHLRAHLKYMQSARTEIVAGQFTNYQTLCELFKASVSLVVYYQRSAGCINNDTEKPNNRHAVSGDVIDGKSAESLQSLLKVSLEALNTIPLVDKSLDPATKHAISVMMNFSIQTPPSIKCIWMPKDEPWKNFDRILSLLSGAIDKISSRSLFQLSQEQQIELTPLILVLLRAVAESKNVQHHIKSALYPMGVNNTELPEESVSLAGKLIRILKYPHGGMLPSAVGDLLYFLWDRDPKKFIISVGYGNAAGYMVSRGIPIPDDLLATESENSPNSQPIDPVTGRYFNGEDPSEALKGMTDEEKEREAERLFVLFERLNKTGIIKVENPVRAAMESGRFQEIDSNSSDHDNETNE